MVTPALGEKAKQKISAEAERIVDFIVFLGEGPAREMAGVRVECVIKVEITFSPPSEKQGRIRT